MADDWDKPTIIRKGRVSSKEARSNANINLALATGNAEIYKKVNAGNNKQHGSQLNLAKLENENDEVKIKTVDKKVSQAIMSGRQAKNLNQKEFATAISEKIQVVQDYEQGKAVPNQQVLGKMERVLGVKLRGENVGIPLAPK